VGVLEPELVGLVQQQVGSVPDSLPRTPEHDLVPAPVVVLTVSQIVLVLLLQVVLVASDHLCRPVLLKHYD
jgi:hypothetical protein